MKIAGFRKELKENRRDFPARLVILALVYLVMLAVGVGFWAHVWAAICLLTQAALYRGLTNLLDAPSHGFRRRARLFQLSLTFVNLVFGASAILLWFLAGELGRLLAAFILLGAMIHVGSCETLTRITFATTLGPYLVIFMALPLAEFFLRGDPGFLTLEVAALAVSAHVAVAAWRKMRMDDALNRALATARRERRAAIDASGAKTAFLATISHEIRTPMNAVSSSARLLEGGMLDPGQRAHVTRLRSAANVMTALLNDVLDFSRIEAGKMEVARQPEDLRTLLAAIFDIWGQKAREKGLRFTASIGGATPARAETDGLRLQQILLNLLSNAVKFTEAGEVRVRADWRDGALEVTISDTGIGIAADRLESVFASFEQGGADISQRFGGTGLGLAISSELTRMMGGTLRVDSAPGRGSTFTLTLPMTILAAPAPAQKARDVVDLRGMRVLAVDDSEPNREVIKALLEPQGVALEMAQDGIEAVGKAEATRYDAILMDMRMPRMDGVEATRRLRKGGACRNAPIFAVTANVFEEHRKLWVEAGADEFVGKPIDFDALLTLLDRYRQQGRAA